MSNEKNENIKTIISERNPKALFLEKDFDEALIGSAIQCGKNHVAIYDSNKCIKILMKTLEEGGVGEEEAYEQFQCTVKSTKPSENNPIIFSDFSNIEIPNFPDIAEDMTIEDVL